MQIPHQTYKIDLNNINEPLTRMIESVNDKGVRYVDVELWANSQKVTLPQNCTATAAFVTDGFLISESVDCAISDDLTTVIVPIDNAKIESKSGIMLVEIKITDGSGNILTPPFAFKVRVKKSITEDANIFEKSYGTVSEILKEVAAARGDYDNLNARFNSKLDNTAGSVTTDNIASKAVTSDKIANGAITALKIANGAVSGSNIAQNQISTNHLQSGAVTVDKLANNVIETGSGNLNIPVGDDGKTQSATFKYQRVGDYVDVSIYLLFNDFTTRTDTRVGYGNLPYICEDDLIISGACSYNKKLVEWYVVDKTNGFDLKLPDNTIFIGGTNLTFNIKYRIA